MVSAALLGTLGGGHCVAMCSGLSQASLGTRWSEAPIWREHLLYLLGRILSYASLGALVAAAGGILQWSGQSFAAFRAIWTLFNALLCALGLVLLITAQQPLLLNHWAHLVWNRVRRAPGAMRVKRHVPNAHSSTRRSFLIGALWGLLPCGLLWSALALAALAPNVTAGAAIMVAFAASSSTHLALAGRLRRLLEHRVIRRWGERLGTRVSGLMMIIAATATLWSIATGLPNPLCAPQALFSGP